MTTAGGIWLPRVDFAAAQVGGVASRDTLSSVARSVAAQQVQASAAWAPCRILYGRQRMGADLYDMGVLGGDLILFLIWGYGPWDGIESFTLGDEAPPAGVTVTHYDGTQTTHNTTLAQLYGVTGNPARLAQMVYPNLVYSVVRVPPGLLSGFPQCAAIWRGRKLYDPRAGGHDPDVPATWAYSTNPSLALADFRRSAVYGMSRVIDWASVETCADANDTVLDGKPRSAINQLLDKPDLCERWSDALATYAECWVLDDGATSKFVPDGPVSPVMDFDHAAGQIIELAPLEFTRPADSPNVIEIAWTDTTQIPWREQVATAVAPGVDTAGAEVRLSRVPLPGVHDASQAARHAIQRLNKINLCDLTTSLKAPDRAAPVEVGDTIRLTHPCGLALKTFRVTATDGQMGDYSLGLTEYDVACYSNAVVAYSETPDTPLPNPSEPPAVTDLVLTEENYVTRDGTTQTRFRASWTAPDWPWPITYRAVFTALGVPPVERGVAAAEALSDQVQEGLLYQVQVFTLARGLASDPVTATETAIGKGLLPGNVTSGSAFEVGGEVRVTIGAAIDKDLKFYELRYDDGSLTDGVGGETWATIWAAATFVDATPAASGVGGFIATKSIPVGDWRLLICALDSVDQYSPVPYTLPVTVTLDVNSFLVGAHDYTNPTLTGMVEFGLPGDATRYFITEDNVPAATKFPGLAGAYPNIAATYHAAQTSKLLTEAWGVGVNAAGNWRGTLSSTALSGSKTDSVLLSSDGSNYTDYGGLTAKANGAYGKLQSIATGASTLLVALPTAQLRLDAIPRVESGTVTTDANGFANILLENAYTATQAIVVTPQGSTAANALYDNIQLDSGWSRGQKTLLGAGQEVLVFENTAGSSAPNRYDYFDFYQTGYPPSGYTSQAGDYLEYDQMALADPAAWGGMRVCVFNGVWGGGGTEVFTTGWMTSPVGQWESRKIAVNTVGLVLTHCAAVFDGDVAGVYRFAVRNVRITNGAGTTRRILWQSGRPVIANWLGPADYANRKANYANSFDVYTFSGASAAPNRLVQWTFEGV